MMHIYRNSRNIVDSIATMKPCDTLLTSIAVFENANNQPENFLCPDGSNAHLYSFVWYDNVNGTLLGLKYHTEVFFAASIADALDRWYRYLRLVGTGASHDDAMEIADSLNWCYYNFRFSPLHGGTSLFPESDKPAKKKSVNGKNSSAARAPLHTTGG